MIPSSYEPIGSDSPIENGENVDGEGDDASQQSKWRKAIQKLRQVDKSFFVSKAFYFFFYTALGSLFPFFSLFYKQLWLTPGQIGLLLALRPAVKLVCLPLWKMVTDRFSRPKVVYFISILGWTIGYFGQSLVYPTNLPCYGYQSLHSTTSSPNISISNSSVVSVNNITTRSLLQDSHPSESLQKWDPRNYRPLNRKERDQGYLLDNAQSTNLINNFARAPTLLLNEPTKNKGIYANLKGKTGRLNEPSETYSRSLKEGKNKDGVTDADSQENDHEVEREIKADTATSGIVERKKDDVIKVYEKMGSLIPSPKEYDDFRIKFNTWIFRCLILIVILTEIITTPTPMLADIAIVQSLVETKSEYGKQRLFGSLGLSLAAILVAVWVSLNTDCLFTDTIDYIPCFYLFEIAIGATVLVSLFVKFDRPDSEASNGYEFLDAMKLFKNFKNGVFLVTLFAFGFFHSLHYAFLFWYLQDLGGTPVLFSIILLIYCLAEVMMYFVSGYVVEAIGQQGMICLAFACYTARYLMYSYLRDPWLVTPMEMVQGITYGGVWSIAAVYVNAPPEASHMVQSILHGSYWGLGMALGPGISGVIIGVVGAPTLFLISAGICFLLCMFHLGIDIHNKMKFLEEEQEHRLRVQRGETIIKQPKKKERESDFIGAAAAPLVPCLLYAR
ncbi:major facilitator superfamily domain-containing protein 6-like [Porites lutea]|uniref:major facilitator superfamily domain-containing protein 6-like n=1 Tax=Porites lutea TaxID=51062 RepID=UPI003CC6DAA2